MREMTLPEVLSDPLIRQLMRADKVSLQAFKALLREAAARVEEEADVKAAAAHQHTSDGASPKINPILQEEAV